MVTAVNSVGMSKPSQKVTAIPLCLEESTCQVDTIPGEDTCNIVIKLCPFDKKSNNL